MDFLQWVAASVGLGLVSFKAVCWWVWVCDERTQEWRRIRG